ncbi:MAG: ABC transporter permease subunit [Thermoplasmatota archaeon]
MVASATEHRAVTARLAVLGAVLALVALVAWSSTHGPDNPLALPYLALRSLLRVAVAFVLSVLFAIVYGVVAANNRRAGRVLIPLLDILQSVPILAFFPLAIAVFVSLLKGPLGLEAASVFLVFTSQSWNLAFGVYEAVLSIPEELAQATSVFGVAGWMKAKRVLLPACVPQLVYNGILSWAGGWYFITASEVLTSGDAQLTAPGLGSFLFRASVNQNAASVFWGLFALVTIIVSFEFLLWRPLKEWAVRFRLDATGARARTGRVQRFYASLIPAASARHSASMAKMPTIRQARRSGRRLKIVGERVVAIVLLAGLVGVAAALAYAVAKALEAPLESTTLSIPLALLASTLRLFVAYIITLVWTIPVAIWVSRSERASRVVLPLTEVLAALPAAALFPVIVWVFIRATGSLEVPSILLILTGMQWYLLFNLMAGARQIPSDLLDASRVYGLRGRRLWQRVYLPAMVPALLTGSITAWGGGWNALIVSEFIPFGGHVYQVRWGIGALIQEGSASKGHLLLLAGFAMVVFVVALNALVWRPLYRAGMRRYRMEGWM